MIWIYIAILFSGIVLLGAAVWIRNNTAKGLRAYTFKDISISKRQYSDYLTNAKRWDILYRALLLLSPILMAIGSANIFGVEHGIGLYFLMIIATWSSGLLPISLKSASEKRNENRMEEATRTLKRLEAFVEDNIDEEVRQKIIFLQSKHVGSPELTQMELIKILEKLSSSSSKVSDAAKVILYQIQKEPLE